VNLNTIYCYIFVVVGCPHVTVIQICGARTSYLLYNRLLLSSFPVTMVLTCVDMVLTRAHSCSLVLTRAHLCSLVLTCAHSFKILHNVLMWLLWLFCCFICAFLSHKQRPCWYIDSYQYPMTLQNILNNDNSKEYYIPSIVSKTILLCTAFFKLRVITPYRVWSIPANPYH